MQHGSFLENHLAQDQSWTALVTVTVDMVEEPVWLIELLRMVCTSRSKVVICNSKVIQPAVPNPIIFDLDVAEFVRSYCLSCGTMSVHELSHLETIRPAPQDPNQDELSALKSSLRSGWQSGHVVICSKEGTVLLDGATRVYLLSDFIRQGVSVASDLPVVQCLEQTPAWIINAIIVLLSQSDDRRTWSPSDTLNLAAYQIESLRHCQEEVKKTAIKRLRKEKVFNGLGHFIDVASVVQSRELCSQIARNLVMKNGHVTFFKKLNTKIFLDNCKKVLAGSDFTKKPRQELMSEFVSKLQSSAISDVLHDMFKGCQHDSIVYGICVEHTHSVGPVSRLVLKWNSDNVCHESKSHQVRASQYNRFELWDRNQNSLIATKYVASLVPELGCMQGTANTAWSCESKGHFVNVTALDSDSNVEAEDSVTCCDPKPLNLEKGLGSQNIAISVGCKRKKSAYSNPEPGRSQRPHLSPVLKHELWLSFSSLEYNIQALWDYVRRDGSDLKSFEVKMEARLKSLCWYHADLYNDPRFNAIGSRLIIDARSIQKGFKPTFAQKLLLHFHLVRFGWLATPVLWNCAELLFLLTTLFDPRLLFVHVFQKDAKLQFEKTQNWGMAACSKILSSILFERLQEFDLLSTEHQCGDAVVLDSNGSYLQHFQAERTTNFFKAMEPHKVVKVSNAPAALSCNGYYTQIRPNLYAQNITYPSNEFEPEPRIIEVTDRFWCFKHLLAQGVDCWIMRANAPVSEIPDLVNQSQWKAWRGFDGNSDHEFVEISITEDSDSDQIHAFDYGSGGGYQRIEKIPSDSVLLAQREHSDGNPFYDPLEFKDDGTIVLTQPPIFSKKDMSQSEIRASIQATKGKSHLPVRGSPYDPFSAPNPKFFEHVQKSGSPSSSVFNGPLGALFCLMFGTRLGFSECNFEIPIGACILFSFLFPHRGALYDYLNRRFHLYILNGNFNRIPGANVEQRFRILACSKQRHHAHGGVDFYDLSLLHNLQTFEISGSGASRFRQERFRIVFGDDWVYSGDINLAKEPNGYGTMVSRDSERSGFFQNGIFVKDCDEYDDAVAATRHVNILYLSLEFLKGGPNAMLVKGNDIEVMEEFDSALNALISVPNFLEYVSLVKIAHEVESLLGQRLSRFKVSAKQVISKFMQRDNQRSSAIFADDGVNEATSTYVRESTEAVIAGTEEKASEFSAPAASNVVTGSGLVVFSDASRATIFGRVAQLSSNLEPHVLLQQCQKCHEELSNIVDAAVRRGDDQVLSNVSRQVSGACDILIGLIDARQPKLKKKKDSKQFKDFINAFVELASQCDSHKNKKQPQSQMIFGTESQVAVGAVINQQPGSLPLSHSNFFGLPNNENSCWLNATLQCLLHTTELSLSFLNPDFDCSSLHESNSIASDNPFPGYFKALVNFPTKGHTDKEFLTKLTLDLKVELGKRLAKRDSILKSNELTSQFMDSAECLIVLVECICPSLFRLEIKSQLICDQCSKSSIKSDPPDFCQLPFFPGAKKGTPASLMHCLSLYLTSQLLSGAEKPFCSDCRCQTNQTKQLILHDELPNIFFFTLKRFEFKPNGSFKCITRQFDVPLEYDFGFHCSPPKSKSFRIYAVVCYQNYHYFAYCRPTSYGPWMEFNDLNVKEIAEEQALNQIQHYGYTFFWRMCQSSRNKEDEVIIDDAQVVTMSCMQQQVTFSRTQVSDDVFSLPRHFSFEFAELQNRAIVLVEQQNNSVLIVKHNPNVLLELKKHLTRGYDLSNEQCQLVYPEAYSEPSDSDEDFPLSYYSAIAPCIQRPQEFISTESLNWFFIALTTLFPGAMLLPCALFKYLEQPVRVTFRIWKENLYSKCPYAVLFPLNLPKNLKFRSSHSNPEYHWVFIGIDLTWAKHVVSDASLLILDPFNNLKCHSALSEWCTNVVAPALGFNVRIQPHNNQFVKLQCGGGNAHCGVFTMALGLNFLTKTLDKMGEHLIKDRTDTCSIGLELRKMVAWDCLHKPSLLNACLAMSPIFMSSPALESLNLDTWWRVTYSHDIVTVLTLQPEFVAGGLFHELGLLRKKGTMKKNYYHHPSVPVRGKVPTDGPFFFQNQKFFVKVLCMGLLHDKIDHLKCKISIKRAGLALLESSATHFACEKENIWVATFGVICVGITTPCAFVCVGREILVPIAKETTHAQLGSLFNAMASEPLHMLHLDPHSGNAMVTGDGKMQAIDFERSSRCIGPAPIALFFQYYASSVASNNQASIQIMMPQLRWSGLDRAYDHFAGFVTEGKFLQHAFNSSAFQSSPATHFRYAGFWHLMNLLYIAATSNQVGIPELAKIGSKMCISCIIGRESAPCNIFFEYLSTGAICFTSAVLQNAQQRVLWKGSFQDPTEDQARDFLEQLLNDEVFAAIPQQQQQPPLAPHDPDPAPAPVPLAPHAPDPAPAPVPAPAPAPASDATFKGLLHLMELLNNAAQNEQDTLARLERSQNQEWISCHIRPLCSREVAVACTIVFERKANGSIMIISAEFGDHKDYLQSQFMNYRGSFILSDSIDAQRFFDFALSMESLYSSGSCTDSGCDELAMRISAKRQKDSSRSDSAGKKISKVSGILSQVFEKSRLPNHSFLCKSIEKHGNEHVLRSLQDSMHRRFGDAGKLGSFKITNKTSKPLNAFREEHFGCKSVLVGDVETRDRCIKFISSQAYLSVDTESAVPRHNDDRSISLIQIGTSTDVFIIQVARQPSCFFTSLRDSLSGKTLLSWDNEEDALNSVVADLNCFFVDVQKDYSPAERKLGLADCIEKLFASKYVLNKTWRLSGWDNNPLTKGQLTYAALDVVCCHALYVAKNIGRDSVYVTDGKYITFYACDIHSQSKAKHGFSFAPDFLGHYNNGTVSRGFQFSQSPPLLQGFIALEDASHGVASVDLQSFVDLLNGFQLCCALCSSCLDRTKWKIDLTTGSNLCSYTKGGKKEDLLRYEVSNNASEQNAYYCLSILASVLELSPSRENLQRLKQSVCSDIYYGYIRETLGHLITDDVFSSSTNFFGHYVGFTAIRGFRLDSSFAYPQGFKAASVACDLKTDLVLVDGFQRLLNQKKFCCSKCTDSFTRLVQRSIHTVPAAFSKGGHVNCFATSKGLSYSKYVRREVAYDTDKSLQLNEAIFCLSMLGAFFGCEVQDTTSLGDNLLYSVHQDVHDGYISKTLAYL
jgi:ubiquitin C-terminal hydrolase